MMTLVNSRGLIVYQLPGTLMLAIAQGVVTIHNTPIVFAELQQTFSRSICMKKERT